MKKKNFFEGLMGLTERSKLQLIIPDGKKDLELYAYKNCPLFEFKN